jgi:hypothetical protein
MTTKQKFLSTLTALGMMAGIANAQSVTIYTEDFGTDDGNVATTTVDWEWVFGTEATAPADYADASALNPFLGPSPVTDGGAALIATGFTSTGHTTNAWERSDTYFFFDTSPSFNTTSGGSLLWSDLDEFSFAANRGGNFAGSTRAAINVGGTWYVSPEQTLTTTVDTYTIDIQAANWSVLTVNPGTALSIAATADTLAQLNASGDLQGVGVYVTTSTPGSGSGRQWRVDDLEITAIPEPGTLALVGIALGSLLLFRRKK